MCDVRDRDFQRVVELAAEVEDGELSAALTLIVRGHYLARPVRRALLNAAACMLDAHDRAVALFQRDPL